MGLGSITKHDMTGGYSVLRRWTTTIQLARTRAILVPKKKLMNSELCDLSDCVVPGLVGQNQL